MDFGSFSSGLLTGLREGVEAALIVSIVLAYLVRTGNAEHIGKIWLGTGIAVLAECRPRLRAVQHRRFVRGAVRADLRGQRDAPGRGVVTWMLFWMRRQAASVKGDLQAAVDRVLDAGGAWGLALLAFTAVIREGVETSLFLVGQATSAETNARLGSRRRASSVSPSRS